MPRGNSRSLEGDSDKVRTLVSILSESSDTQIQVTAKPEGCQFDLGGRPDIAGDHRLPHPLPDSQHREHRRHTWQCMPACA